MGLDMYAYVAAKAGEHDEYHAAEGSYVDGEWTVPSRTKPRELAYWRKHPNLHGWMEQLWNKRNGGNCDGNTFNGIELELTWEDIDQLEHAVTHSQLPGTAGFFFGEDSDQHYRKSDLEFIRNARAELFLGLKVFYNSSW